MFEWQSLTGILLRTAHRKWITGVRWEAGSEARQAEVS